MRCSRHEQKIQYLSFKSCFESLLHDQQEWAHTELLTIFNVLWIETLKDKSASKFMI